MLITKQELIERMKAYITEHMLSKMDGWQMLVGSIWVNLFATNATKELDKYLSSSAISMLDIVSEDGRIDIDKVYKAFSESKENFKPIVIDLELVGMGKYTFNADDVKIIYQYLQGE